jgi:hypothetical protein
LFNSLALGRQRLGLEPLPKLTLMADAAQSISNGFVESELDCGIRGICWFHCKKSIDKRLTKVRDKDKKVFLLSSIYKLQVCQTPEIFKCASALFVEQCLDDEDHEVVDFITGFKEEWLDQNSTWFEGYNFPKNAGSPSTNNGNEGINGVIKTEDTLRELLPLYSFLVVSSNLVYKWSRARDPMNANYKPFATEPSIRLCQWTLGYQYKSKFGKLVFQENSEPNFWYVNSSDGIQIESSDVQ